MKLVRNLVGALLALVALVALLFVAQLVASESGEVATVYSTGSDAAAKETRVWVVDHAGAQWLRTGNAESQWMTRLRAQPLIELERGGEKRPYLAVAVPEARDTVNGLMTEKYGWADGFIGLMFSRTDAQVVRLDPR